MTDAEKRGRAVDRIAEQFPEMVVKHVPGRVCVTRDRIYGQPYVTVPVWVPGLPVMQLASYDLVEIYAEPVPSGWAYAVTPRDLMRA